MKKPNQQHLAKLAITAGLVFATIWLYHQQKQEARFKETVNRGRNIFTLHFSADFDDFTYGDPSPFPRVGEFASSTEHFNAARYAGKLEIQPPFFSAPGVPAATGYVLHAENNAWCIAAGLSLSTPANAPVLFTRNLILSIRDGQVPPTLTDEMPFGKKAAVVVFLGGSAIVIKSGDLHEAFKSLDPKHVANILRP